MGGAESFFSSPRVFGRDVFFSNTADTGSRRVWVADVGGAESFFSLPGVYCCDNSSNAAATCSRRDSVGDLASAICCERLLSFLRRWSANCADWYCENII